jgi:hypothetical protein
VPGRRFNAPAMLLDAPVTLLDVFLLLQEPWNSPATLLDAPATLMDAPVTLPDVFLLLQEPQDSPATLLWLKRRSGVSRIPSGLLAAAAGTVAGASFRGFAHSFGIARCRRWYRH